ncbi:MAG TPA: LCP family protein [Candidatus Saccharimonadales bacterium]|nr:LCP family protein [Candidatus Saccharimonadales bacterium]
MDTVTTGRPAQVGRSPHKAAFLSFLWPGLGHWYGGRVRAAILFGVPVLGVVFLLLMQIAGGLGQLASLLLTPSSALTVLILIGLLAVWRLLAIADSMTVGTSREPFRHRRTLTTFGVLALLVVVSHGVMAYTAWAFYDASSRIFVNEVSPEGTVYPSTAPGQTPTASDDYVAAPIATPETLSSRINVLLTGIDSAETRNTALTDTLMVASIDPETADVVLISIPRDISDFELFDGRTFTGKINSFMTWVRNHPEDFDDTPLNSLVKQVGHIIGAPIHYYAAVDLAGFRRMIDLVGGVTVDNPRAINDPRYDWLDGRHGFALSAGKHKLDGKTALAYVRSRQGAGDSDFTRARRQQQVLLALRSKLTDPSMLPELPDILDAAADTVKTNFPSDRVGEMIDLAQQVDTENVRQYVLGPSKYAVRPPYSETGGIYKLRLRMDAVAKLSMDIFGNASRYASLPEYAPVPTPSPGSTTP